MIEYYAVEIIISLLVILILQEAGFFGYIRKRVTKKIRWLKYKKKINS